MAVGQVQLYNQAFSTICASANTQWDTASGFAFVLAKSTYTPLDTHTTLANVGTGDVDYIVTGDGAAILVPSLAIVNSSGNTQFNAGNANFGASVTITAKYLLCVEGDATLAGTDKLIFWQNLDTSGGSAVSSASDFVVQAPAGSTWFQINVQA